MTWRGHSASHGWQHAIRPARLSTRLKSGVLADPGSAATESSRHLDAVLPTG